MNSERTKVEEGGRQTCCNTLLVKVDKLAAAKSKSKYKYNTLMGRAYNSL